jgi:lipopolysaccharide transport system ATP-binding protein
VADTVIHIDHLGKQYEIGSTRKPYRTLRESIADAVLGPMRRLRREDNRPRRTAQVVWALREVSLEVREGEVLGVIGRNGAGKTTLLKILSRITMPTEGCVRLSGRVGSLLEVGTGFHPELTGAENVYLSGAILGMSRREIRRKFDEIVSFADVETFLQTPVKYYSSGMYMRLAFAVAAHLEPEILLVDEVLAVGDEVFQRKCLGKMGEVARTGRTVLFVSHNLAAVRSLCPRAVLLRSGRVEADGNCEDILQRYLADMDATCGEVHFEPEEKKARLCRVALLDRDGRASSRICMEEPFGIEIDYELEAPLRGAHVACYLRDRYGAWILATTDADADKAMLGARPVGRYRASWNMPAGILNAGKYHLSAAIGIHNVELFDWKDAFSFDLEPTVLQSAVSANASIHPVLQIRIPWKTEAV